MSIFHVIWAQLHKPQNRTQIFADKAKFIYVLPMSAHNEVENTRTDDAAAGGG